jgi:hypothetical protein
LKLLEEKVVELAIVDHASDNTIGRVLKKHFEAASEPAMGHSSQVERSLRGGDGGHFGPLYATARPGTSTGLRGPSQNVCLSKSDTGFDLRLVSWLEAAPEGFPPNNAPPSRHRFG